MHLKIKRITHTSKDRQILCENGEYMYAESTVPSEHRYIKHAWIYETVISEDVYTQPTVSCEPL